MIDSFRLKSIFLSKYYKHLWIYYWYDSFRLKSIFFLKYYKHLSENIIDMIDSFRLKSIFLSKHYKHFFENIIGFFYWNYNFKTKTNNFITTNDSFHLLI